MAKRFGYQMQHLSAARSCLMIPLTTNEENSFANAFNSCFKAFMHFDENQVDDEEAKTHIQIIKRIMDTKGINDPTGEGTSLLRARALTQEEKEQFSASVNELADYFHMQFWPDS
jgi:hypothetical protein